MHELSLMKDLLHKIEQIALENQPLQLQSVTVVLGALSHISAQHFREHFQQAVAGSELESVALEVEFDADIHSPTAQDILLKSVDLTEP